MAAVCCLYLTVVSVSLHQVLGLYIHRTNYTLRKLNSTVVYVRFSIEDETFNLYLQNQRPPPNPRIYLINQNHELERLHFSRTDNNCSQYEGSDLYSSYSVVVCSQHLKSAIIVRSHEYFIVEQIQQEGDSTDEITVEHYDIAITENDVVKGVKIPSHKSHKPKRVKREDFQGTIKAKVQVAIFTEHLLFIQYCPNQTLEMQCVGGTMKLNNYVITLLVGANLYYSRIDDSQLQISLEVASIIHNARQEHPETGEDVSMFAELEAYQDGQPMVDSSKGLDRFAQYQQAYLNRPGEEVLADHSTLITIHGLMDENKPGFRTIGIAYVGGVCDTKYKSSVCQQKPGYSTLYIVAHEIGHNLGAAHDGRYDSCPGEDNYIMATHNLKTNMQNSFYFSCCSQAEMFLTIRDFGSCLAVEDDTLSSPPESLSPLLPGVKLTRADQCILQFDDQHVACDQATIDSNKVAMGYTECEAHWCYDKVAGFCKLSANEPVLAGTDCGTGKWCIEGQCIPNTEMKPGVNRPHCDFKTLEMKQSLETDPDENSSGNPMEMQLMFRIAAIISGLALLAIGTVILIKFRRRQLPNLPIENQNANSANVPIPPQYDKVLFKPPQHYHDVKEYNERIHRLSMEMKTQKV